MILDFGLARSLEKKDTTLTQYVQTRWYRSPEVIYWKIDSYTNLADMWSVGCIAAELLTGSPLFPGDDGILISHQMYHILSFSECTISAYHPTVRKPRRRATSEDREWQLDSDESSDPVVQVLQTPQLPWLFLFPQPIGRLHRPLGKAACSGPGEENHCGRSHSTPLFGRVFTSGRRAESRPYLRSGWFSEENPLWMER